MSFQAEAPSLRFPENLGLHASVNLDAVVNMLVRAAQLSLGVPYTWTFIDKPVEGQVVIIFLANPAQFPNDGIRYQDQETRYVVSAAGNREVEVIEIKYGFVPNSQDTVASRLRRRYRLLKGGHAHITLVHYARGQTIPIVPSLLNSPVRQYPLRQISEPPVYVMGDKAGQKVFPPSAGPPPPQGPMGMNPQGMGITQPGMPMVPQGMNTPAIGMNAQGIALTPQAMLAQQNSNMESLERRRERERARERSGSMGAQRAGPPRLDDDDSADEFEMISTRTLALMRYKRNHEFMEEVFKRAAFGALVTPPQAPPAYSIFNNTELESKVAKLQEEVETLQAQAAERMARKSAAEDVFVASGHTPMEEVAS